MYIESKGHENDRFGIIKKLFRKWLDEHNDHAYYFVVRSIKQLKDALEILQYGKILDKTKKTKKK